MKTRILIIAILILFSTGINNIKAQTSEVSYVKMSVSSPIEKAYKLMPRSVQIQEIKRLQNLIEQNEAKFDHLIKADNLNMTALYENIDELQVLENKLFRTRFQILNLIFSKK